MKELVDIPEEEFNIEVIGKCNHCLKVIQVNLNKIGITNFYCSNPNCGSYYNGEWIRGWLKYGGDDPPEIPKMVKGYIAGVGGIETGDRPTYKNVEDYLMDGSFLWFFKNSELKEDDVEFKSDETYSQTPLKQQKTSIGHISIIGANKRIIPSSTFDTGIMSGPGRR